MSGGIGARACDHEAVTGRDPWDDSPKEACGVFGVFGHDLAVAHLTFLGLYALQHRGQESAGMEIGRASCMDRV